MHKEITVTFNKESEKKVLVGTTLKEFSENYKDKFKYDILIAKVNNDIVELEDTLTKSCNVEFYDRSSTLGHSIYSVSANYILILAVKNVLGSNAKIIFQN